MAWRAWLREPQSPGNRFSLPNHLTTNQLTTNHLKLTNYSPGFE